MMLAMAPTFNQLQQTFCLNQIANVAADIVADQATLQQIATQRIEAVLADAEIQALIGRWQVVWGPVVYQFPGGTVGKRTLPASKVADNTMFVAQAMTATGQPSNTYVVGVAGTDPRSWYGWFIEDFTLSPMLAWPYASDTGGLSPMISSGTATGLGVLTDMTAEVGGRSMTLSAFLASVIAAGSGSFEIAVSGHSLGGALSPALALALADTQTSWDPNHQAVISVLPTAGPSPGNLDFSMYYIERLGARTNRFWNGVDIVPHAWQLDMLNQAPHLYYPYIAPNAAIEAFVALAEVNSKRAGSMTQLNPQTPALVSQVNFDLIYTDESPLAAIGIDVINAVIAAVGKRLGAPQLVIDLIEKYVDGLLKGAQQATATSGVVQLSRLFSREFEARRALAAVELNGDAGGAGDLVDMVNQLLRFLLQAGWQHTTAYPELLGTAAFAQRSKAIIHDMG